jgi:hypothetical protein
MWSTTLADWDVTTRIKRDGNTYIFETSQDVAPYLDQNAAIKDAYRAHGRDKPFVHAASIPIAAYKLILTELGIPHERMYRLTPEEIQRRNRLLESPDWSLLKTYPGRILK